MAGVYSYNYYTKTHTCLLELFPRVSYEDKRLFLLIWASFYTMLQTFWWLIEGKFGNRDEALAPRLLELVAEAAAKCTADPDVVAPCFNSEWKMETPGSSLSVGITAVSCADGKWNHEYSRLQGSGILVWAGKEGFTVVYRSLLPWVITFFSKLDFVGQQDLHS